MFRKGCVEQDARAQPLAPKSFGEEIHSDIRGGRFEEKPTGEARIRDALCQGRIGRGAFRHSKSYDRSQLEVQSTVGEKISERRKQEGLNNRRAVRRR